MKKIIFGAVFFTICCIGRQAYAAAQSAEVRSAYNQGVDFYTRNDYNKASEQFLRAMNTENKRDEQWTAYNLGNAAFKTAESIQSKDAASAMPHYKEALEFFRRAIELDNTDIQAKINYELTTKKIKETEQQQQQQQQQQEQKQDTQQKDNKQESKSESSEPRSDKEQQQSQKQQKEQSQQQEQTGAQGEEDKDQGQLQQNVSSQESAERNEMTKEQAIMLLDNFQRGEQQQPVQLQDTEQRREPIVGKDW